VAGLNRDRGELWATIHVEVKTDHVQCCLTSLASLKPEKVDRLRASHWSDKTVEVPKGQI